MSVRPSDQFAATTDLLISGAEPGRMEAGELALVRRLLEGAEAGVPDPAFVGGLRQELKIRALSRVHPATAPMHYAIVNTELGRLAIAYRAGRVVYCSRIAARSALSLAGEGEGEGETRASHSELAFIRAVAQQLGALPLREAAAPRKLEREVRDHLEGRGRFRNLDISWLTPFQQRVLEKTAEIPRGEVRPYGWVAREIGAPGATRAVGTALGHNPIPFLIPCHRVVRSDGSLGEYSGGGPAVKQRVLAFEGAPVDEIMRLARSRERYRGSATTRVVCYPSCHAVRAGRPESIVPFASLHQAAAYGYRPCSLCRPA